MERNSCKGKAAWAQFMGECVLQCAGGRARNLVLDGHVEARRLLVLRAEHAMKVLGDFAAQGEHFGTFDAQRSAVSEVHHAGQNRFKWRSHRSKTRKAFAHLVLKSPWKRMKQRDVG